MIFFTLRRLLELFYRVDLFFDSEICGFVRAIVSLVADFADVTIDDHSRLLPRIGVIQYFSTER